MSNSLAMDSRAVDVGRSLAAKWRSRTSICSGVDLLRRFLDGPTGKPEVFDPSPTLAEAVALGVPGRLTRSWSVGLVVL